MFSSFAKKIYGALSKIPFDILVWAVWGSFVFLFVACFAATLKSAKARELSKRPFLCLVNAYAAITLALFLIGNELREAVFAATVFWIAGYLFYGVLCLASRGGKKPPAIKQTALSEIPVTLPQKTVNSACPAAKNNVRLEHAVSVTDKLLSKNLGKGDRQELEKLKNTLAVLQIKGTLTPAESEILNENFNALLKLMAKYNI